MQRDLRSLRTNVTKCSRTFSFNAIMAVSFSLMLSMWSSVAGAQSDCQPEVLINCSAPSTVSCTDFNPVNPTPPTFTVSDCPNQEGEEVTIGFSDTPLSSGACSSVIVRTWTITVGNATGSCSETITVQDNVGPVISGIEDLTIECDQPIPAPVTITAQDACGAVTETDVIVLSSNAGEGSTAGELTECALTTPSGPGPDGAIWLNLNGNNLMEAFEMYRWVGNPTLVSYNDGTAHLLGNVVNLTNNTQGWVVDMWFQNARNWAQWSALGRSYKDDLGLGLANHPNWTYYELTPTFSNLDGTGSLAGSHLYLSHQPANYFYGFQSGIGANNRNGNEGMSGWFFWEGWLNGQWMNGNGDLFTNKSCTPQRSECLYTVTYRYRAQDACGNNSFATQTITVTDTTAPTFNNCPDAVDINCEEAVPAVLTAADFDISDNCTSAEDIVFLGLLNETEETNGCTRTITRTYGASDLCQNRASCVQVIRINDNLPPAITAPADADFDCSETIVFAEATAEDNCSEYTLTEDVDTIAGECASSYTIVRTWTARDECGNESQAEQRITVSDTTPPAFDQQNYQYTASCDQVPNIPAPTATDNCGTATVTLINEQLSSGGCLGTLVRTYRAQDDCGNESGDVFVYIVLVDTVAPTINNPADMTVECDQVPAVPQISITDNCDENPSIDFEETITEGDCANSYTITWSWTATDICGNQSVATTTITVEDTQDPFFLEFPADTTISCSDDVPTAVNPAADDNCDDNVTVSSTDEEIPGDCPNTRTINRIFRAFDNCGHSAIYVQHIYVIDNVAPEFTSVPANITIECTQALPTENATAEDNCGNATVTYSDDTLETSSCQTIIKRTFTAVDECSNSNTAEQIITVVDTQGPQITGAPMVFASCTDYQRNFVEATDSCGTVVSITYVDMEVSGGCTGKFIRTYTAVDNCNNSSTFEQIVELTDEEAPEASNPGDLFVECGSNFDEPVISFTDNCDEMLDVTMVPSSSTDGCQTILKYVYRAEDGCGNVTFDSVYVYIRDTTNPEVFTNAGGTFSCEEAIDYGTASAEDVCDEDVTITSRDTTIAGTCPNSYMIVRTWFATDNCGNVGTITSTYYVVDETEPVFTSVPEAITILCNEEVPVTSAVATDLCSEPTVTHSDEVVEESTCFKLIRRTFVAKDACNNTAEAYQYISVVDTLAPVVDGLPEVERPCTDFAGNYIEVSDNCDENPTITYSDMQVSGTCSGRVIRTYTITDRCDNSSTFEQVIDLIDVTAPTLESRSEDQNIECGEEWAIPTATFTDACDESLDYNTRLSDTTEGCVRTLGYTIIATDNCGNSDSVTVFVYITDSTGPEITVSGGGQYECNTPDADLGSATANDLCSGSVAVEQRDSTVAGSCPNSYSIIRIFTAVDACGNQSQASVTSTFSDDTAPTLSGEAELNVECGSDIPVVEPSATDNCSETFTTDYVDYTLEQLLSGNGPAASTVEGIDFGAIEIICPVIDFRLRQWIVADACGNTAYFNQFVFIQDTTGPVFDSVEAVIEKSCNDYNGIYVTASDVCGSVRIEKSDSFFSGDCQGRVERTYTAYDECNNASSVTQLIFLTDTILPSSANTPENLDLACYETIPGFEPQWSDNCDDMVETDFTETRDTVGCVITITQTWTAEDNCQNIATLSRTITVSDTDAPVWNEGVQNLTIEVTCNEQASFEAPTATDACNSVSYIEGFSIQQGDCPARFTETYTWTAVDECGNESNTITYTVNHIDNTPPSYEGGVEGGVYTCAGDIADETPVFTDLCSEVTVEFSADTIPGTCPNRFTIVKQWTPRDACGNVGQTVSATYEVFDNIAPEFTSVPQDENYQCAPADWTPAEVSATDNCAGEVTVVPSIDDNRDECGNGQIIVTYTASDACGNANMISYTVNIQDTEDPVLSAQPADVVLTCEQEIPAVPVITASDNCTEIVDLNFQENISGDELPAGALSRCRLITPQVEESQSCQSFYEHKDWALWLGSMPSLHRYFNVVSGDLYTWADGSITLTAVFQNTTDPSLGGFTANVKFVNGKNWSQWSTQNFPTSFKADCGGVDANYQDWMYYLLESNPGADLTGYGSYAGSALNLSHAPVSKYFGFQMGDGANNFTPGYGLGGWFGFQGVVLVDNNPVASGTTGSGDFSFLLDCCPRTVITRCWTATDCTGNQTSYCQTIRYEGSGTTAPETAVAPASEMRSNDVNIVALFPNPTAEQAQIQVLADETTRVTIDVIDMTGRRVGNIQQAELTGGQTYRFDINARAFQNGLYQIRVMSDKGVSTKQLNVMR